MTAILTRRTMLSTGLGTSLGTSLASLAPAWAWAASSATAPKPAPPISLAALFPDSGAQGFAGDEAWRGVALAVAAANRHRAQPINLIRADASDPDGTIARLAKTAPPAALLGTMSSAKSFAATAAAELANIPYVELDAPADAITSRGFKMLIRTGLTTADLAAAAAAAITGQIAPAWRKPVTGLRIALLFDDGASDGAFAAAMLGIAQRGKLPILLTMGYDTNTMDLASEVGRMKRAKIDLLVHAGRIEHVLLLYEAMTIAAWRPRMIIGTGPGYGLSAAGAALGRAIENTMVVDAPLYAATGPSDAIAQAYRRQYAISPRGSASLTTYVGTSLVLASLQPGKSLITTLTATRLKRGTLANGWGAAFGANGQNRNSFATLQQWRNGRLITIDTTVSGAAKPVFSL
ncbi:MAG: ABC transporter substrate-binding protein [Acidiphilium sp.]|nr:ABC transporter substrate-binding protein [Acidiphilium sp.]MDD4936159.1 ABC transporter substrate-binding protein [Acidiphilium sp.]